MYLQKLKIAIILYVIILSIVRAQSNIRKARTSEEIRKATSEETTEKNDACCVFPFTYNLKVLFHVVVRLG